jgi:hypothetical protein
MTNAQHAPAPYIYNRFDGTTISCEYEPFKYRVANTREGLLVIPEGCRGFEEYRDEMYVTWHSGWCPPGMCFTPKHGENEGVHTGLVPVMKLSGGGISHIREAYLPSAVLAKAKGEEAA